MNNSIFMQLYYVTPFLTIHFITRKQFRVKETTNADNGNKAVQSTPCSIQSNLDNVLNMSSNMCYEVTRILQVNGDNTLNISSNIYYETIKSIEVSEEDVQNVSPIPIYYETIPGDVQVSKHEVQNVSSNICYEATEKIISKENECYATLQEV